jgi:protease-4
VTIRLSLGLCIVLLAGCRSFPRYVNSSIDLHVPETVMAKLQADLTAPLDRGPLVEDPLPPEDCPGAGGKVAVIDVDGLLVDYNPVGPYSNGENPVALFAEKLQAAGRDPQVRAVVLRLNTPGGGVAATDLMAQTLAEFRAHTGKPVVSCLLDLGTGGGYYLASGCDYVLATPGAVVGAIGVVFNAYYAEVAMEQMNVFNSSIKAGERVDMGTPVRKATDEEKQLFTAMAREYHAAFKQAVLRGRPQLKPDADFFDGRVMTASQAVHGGLVDRIGYLPDAIAAAGEMARAGPLHPVMYRPKDAPARTLYATTSNRPIQGGLIPWSVPGLDRSRLPMFLYLWQTDPTMLRLTGL